MQARAIRLVALLTENGASAISLRDLSQPGFPVASRDLSTLHSALPAFPVPVIVAVTEPASGHADGRGNC